MSNEQISPAAGPAEAATALYHQLIAAWNRRDAHAFAAGFAEGARVVGFDGSEIGGCAQVAAEIGQIFAHHQTGAYVGLVREVHALGADVVLLRAAVGMVPPGQADLNPALNAIQSLVASRREGGWRIELFQNTPAQFHGRPELAEQLTAELRALLGAGDVLLRAVGDADLPILYEQQRDPEACAMANFPSREREPFMAHWAKVLADPDNVKQAILVGGLVAGNMLCFGPPGEREIGYWLGRQFWGQGVATRALRALLGQLEERPLHAYVARGNLASRRVLEKCGFVLHSQDEHEYRLELSA